MTHFEFDVDQNPQEDYRITRVDDLMTVNVKLPCNHVEEFWDYLHADEIKNSSFIYDCGSGCNYLVTRVEGMFVHVQRI